MNRFYSILAACCLAAAPLQLKAADVEEPVDYPRHIKPILRERCYACHGALKQESGLRLDTGRSIRLGGDSGPSVVPGEPDSSLLLERVATTDESYRMPPDGEPLSPREVDLLRSWIEQGAASPPDEAPQADPRRHWAFQRPRRPSVPEVAWQSGRAGERVRNPIDAFIAAGHRDHGLLPVGQASRSALLRRATLDVTGLPPSAEDLRDFLADETPAAWQRAVDRLLDDPAYGERWGRHWMDVWRYSDWYGRRQVNDVRNSYPHIWRWRDWIIESLNRDAGYDHMLRMMLAADELDPENDRDIVALGFIVRNWFSLNYDQWMKDLVEHTGKAFLGLRLNCAHCHDHKYDPITQEEYFRFRAFFEPLELRHDRVPGGPALSKYQRYTPGSGSSLKPIEAGIARVYDHDLQAQTFMYRLGDARNRFDRPPVAPGAPAILGGDQLAIEPVELPARAWYPGLKDFVLEDELSRRRQAIEQATEQLQAAQDALEQTEPELVEQAREAEAALVRAEQTLSDRKRPDEALAGKLSLVLEAGSGRRVLANYLSRLKTIDDQTQLRFLLRLQTDTHAALGLGLDHETGLTGGYVAFRQGRIVTYRAGKRHEEFSPAAYDFAAGQNTFEVTLDLQPSQDRFLLTVVALAPTNVDAPESGVEVGSTDDAAAEGQAVEPRREVLVDRVPAALHGWNAAENPKHLMSIDARAGSIAVFDQFEFRRGNSGQYSGEQGGGEHDGGEPVWRIDFEPPEFTEGDDAPGREGWLDSKWTVAPGRSRIARWTTVPTELAEAERESRRARRALEAARLGVDAAEQRVNAARRERDALTARGEADRARFLAGGGDPDARQLVDRAVAAQHAARQASAEAARLEAERELALAEGRPLNDKQRAETIDKAARQLAEARRQVESLSRAAEPGETSPEYTPLGPKYPQRSTGRRSALARWLTDPANPLPARVAVNHIWMRHFNQPLVDSVFDFGNSGERPSHPELLDWLAVEFIESGWSMKHIHRLILTSQTYRLASSTRREGSSIRGVTKSLDRGEAAGDGSSTATAESPALADNTFLWHFPSRRLEAETIRDAMLQVAEQLDRAFGGQDIDPRRAPETPRRSLYFSVYPEAGGTMPFLQQFDAADPGECYRRNESIVPQQALALNNSQVVQQASRQAAQRLIEQLSGEGPRRERLVQSAFLACLSRECSPREQQMAGEFLDRQIALYGSAESPEEAERRALGSLIRVLFSHNEFVTPR